MRNILFHIPLLFLTLLIVSCEDHFGDINEDPNNPIEVTPNVLLPTVQVRMAYAYNGDASRYLGINSQHIDGVGRQFVVFQNYGIQPSDVDNLWSTFYTGLLNDNRNLRASTASNNYYQGASQIVEAWALLCMTDWWGDVPYSEAFNPLEILQPRFDAQESLFGTILSLLESGRSLLSEAEGAGIPLSSGDIVYGGDASRWIKWANAIEARTLLHRANRTGDYAAVLASLDRGSFESAADDARVSFAESPTNTAPWYQYIEQRDDIEVGANFVTLLASLSDPRINSAGRQLDVPGHPIFVRSRRTPLNTYVEVKFIEAEAALRTGDQGRAHAAYTAAINASLMEHNNYYQSGAFILGVDTLTLDGVNLAQVSADYLSMVDPGESGLELEDIMTQKYIAMFADPESFADWRRTGLPSLSPNTGDQIPRRLPYPLTETLSNSNTPSLADLDIFGRVWWDGN